MQPSTLPVLSFLIPAFVTKRLAEFAHLARKPRSKEAGAGLVPSAKMPPANPMAVAAVNADVDRALFGAVVVTAVVTFHHVVCSRLASRALICAWLRWRSAASRVSSEPWFAVLAALR
jgi:hypothetical protein